MSGKRGNQAIGVSATFTVLAGIIVLTRLYTRWFIVKHFPVEEYLIILAMLCSIGLTICIAIQVDYGMGRHIWEISPSEAEISLKAFWASLLVYYPSLGFTKSSIILQYRRIFPLKAIQIACWLLLAVVTAYTTWTVFGSIFACVPVRAFWTKEPATCLNQFAMWFVNAAINIATDFAIFILPLPVIKSLNLARRQKQGLIGIFAIGGFVCIVSILRLQSLVAISNSEDQTYDNPPAATWSSVETNVGIICSCLPCLRPLMARVLPGVFSSAQHSGVTSQQNRTTSRRRHWTPSTMLSPVSPRIPGFPRSRNANDEDVGNNTIHIETQFHVEVENDDVEKAMGRHKRGSFRSGNSTETLVTDTSQGK